MLKIEDLCFSYGKKCILKNFNLELPRTGIFAIMGPSGCGKSTLFQLISGLLKPTSGKIELKAKKLAFAFQEPRLMPWMTAAENVNFVLGGKKSTLERAKKALLEVGLYDDSDKYPDQLSGGMQKRVSLARVFAAEGDLILLDEPFSGLDSKTKSDIIEKVRKMGERSLVILITHDITEAVECAEKVFDFYELMKNESEQR